jgi:hypothetical protein
VEGERIIHPKNPLYPIFRSPRSENEINELQKIINEAPRTMFVRKQEFKDGKVTEKKVNRKTLTEIIKELKKLSSDLLEIT